MLKALFLSLVLVLSGCATIIDSPRQDITITPVSKDVSNRGVTECKLVNEEGSWNLTLSSLPSDTINIHRDGNPMNVKCESLTQIGSVDVEPDFHASFLFLDLILDYCIISCSVDGYNNSFYEYPQHVTVPMNTK